MSRLAPLLPLLTLLVAVDAGAAALSPREGYGLLRRVASGPPEERGEAQLRIGRLSRIRHPGLPPSGA